MWTWGHIQQSTPVTTRKGIGIKITGLYIPRDQCGDKKQSIGFAEEQKLSNQSCICLQEWLSETGDAAARLGEHGAGCTEASGATPSLRNACPNRVGVGAKGP